MKISTEDMLLLERGTTNENVFFLPDEQLDRKQYVSINKVLTLAGGKWNRSQKGHVFASNAEDILNDLIVLGEVVDAKKEFDFFPTPDELADKLVNSIGIESGQRVLEPSAGDGHIVRAINRYIEANDLKDVEIVCFEIQPDKEDFLKNLPNVSSVVIGDFMEIEPTGDFDAVFMNPPFSKQQDIKHVNHAYQFLPDREGGLASIMSAGVYFRENKLTADFRDGVGEAAGEIRALAEGSFKLSGTNVNTVMVTMWCI